MFGMDLNHGTFDNKPYPYTKPQRANREFVEVLESLLREIWILFVNVSTTTGDPSDRDAIAQLTRKLREMLLDRRRQGTLNEEEFSAVATLDWLRLAVSFDSPIVVELKSESTTEAGRLLKIAERVGMAAHGMSDDYLELAAPASFLLRGIEMGALVNFADYILNRDILETIITRWSRATGRSLKAKPVQPQAVAS
jgi:hypothetical protein